MAGTHGQHHTNIHINNNNNSPQSGGKPTLESKQHPQITYVPTADIFDIVKRVGSVPDGKGGTIPKERWSWADAPPPTNSQALAVRK